MSIPCTAKVHKQQASPFLETALPRPPFVFLMLPTPTIPILFPFRIDINPMDRLLLVNFEKDPDTVYVGFEPQVFDDEINGHGHLIVAWRKDGCVDVYHQPGVIPHPESYDIAGKGLAHINATEFETAHFHINRQGVHAHYVFRDMSGRNIEIRVEEKNNLETRPFDLLAPMGHAAENPSALPLFLLFDFYFVRRKHTDLRILIDGKPHRADAMPLPIDGKRMYFTRYSARPLIATLNPRFSGEITPIWAAPGERSISSDQRIWYLSGKKGGGGVEKYIRLNPVAPLEMHFSPPFPDLLRIPDQSAYDGRFQIISQPGIGSMAGTYSVRRHAQQVHLRLHPSEGWRPQPDRWMLRLIYRVAKPFKHWPKTYLWEADLDLQGHSAVMKSGWNRL